jgi:pentapeptide MXKDX repeat protein
MRCLINIIVCAGVLCAGTQSFAGDSTQSGTPPITTDHQMFKDCMTKHAAQNDGMSKTDMRQVCIKEVHLKNHSGVANTPTDSPANK